MSTKRFKVTLEVEVDAPDHTTNEEIRKFLAYEFNAGVSLSMTNPCYEEGEYEILTYDIDEI